jgi:hypothetical protein
MGSEKLRRMFDVVDIIYLIGLKPSHRFQWTRFAEMRVFRVLWVGAVAGTLDIADAVIFNAFRGVTPAMVLRYIASGLVGIANAVALGAMVIVLGLALHYLIALGWTAVLFAARRRWAWLRRRPVIGGLGHGAVVFAIMNAVVLPLSRVPPLRDPMTVAARVNAVLAVVLFIGLVPSLLFHRFTEPAHPSISVK